jgi:hypothetical protein
VTRIMVPWAINSLSSTPPSRQVVEAQDLVIEIGVIGSDETDPVPPVTARNIRDNSFLDPSSFTVVWSPDLGPPTVLVAISAHTMPWGSQYEFVARGDNAAGRSIVEVVA